MTAIVRDVQVAGDVGEATHVSAEVQSFAQGWDQRSHHATQRVAERRSEYAGFA